MSKPTKDTRAHSPDLSVSIAGVKLRNPLILASGILGTEAELLFRVAKAGAAAVTSKTCGLKPRKGHENPTVLDWGPGLINAVGLTNPGAEAEVAELRKLRRLLNEQNMDTKIVASFFGCDTNECVKVAKIVEQAEPDFLELNISCPNVEDEHGRPYATDPKATYKVVKAVKTVIKTPMIAKLSPNVTDIQEISEAAEDGGADVVSAINTVSGMLIDTESGKPILTNVVGGISGPAVKPIALRAIYLICQSVKIPVIGLGGISSGEDAIQMMSAGATAVSIGSAVYQHGINVFTKVQNEIKEFMVSHDFKDLSKIRGRAQ